MIQITVDIEKGNSNIQCDLTQMDTQSITAEFHLTLHRLVQLYSEARGLEYKEAFAEFISSSIAAVPAFMELRETDDVETREGGE